MMKKNFFILILMPGLLKAQFVTDYLKAADSYYKKGDYYSAAQYYEKYLASKGTKAKPEDYNPYNVKPASGVKSAAPNAQLAVYNLAESYRQLNYPVKAVAYYEQALSYKNSQLPLALYYYAVTLRALANYEGAERAFQQFLDEYKIEDVYANSAKSEVLNLHFIREQLNRNDLTLYSEEKLGQQINPGGANYSPVWVNKNTLLFTSTRTEGDSSRNKPYLNRLYEAVYENGEVKSVNKIEIPQGAGIHQGVAAVSPDGKTMFLTRWSLAAGKKTSAIYTSKKLDSGWAEPVMFDALVNTPGYNAQQPFVMADGKTLLFSSDKPGGSGGFDLWYATLDANGKPGKAVNLGATINTVNDEQAPYYHDSSGTLVFSCNGRTGMGGFDFFFSKGSLEAWATPENFGYPVNSIKDDIYFTSRGGVKNILEDVLLSSDRSAECCLELFNLKKKDSIPNPVPVPDTEVVMEEPKVESVIVLENVYYDFDSSTLRVESYPALDKLVGLLNEYPTMVIEIRAHTDNKGNDKYNLNLSGARAKVVVDYLISKGIHKDRLQSKGYGASIPVAPNTHEDGSDDPDGRQKNRRTEFKVLSK